jgi:DNA-directed RNA polymerase subunit M/transcription elongation factor TFIIS
MEIIHEFSVSQKERKKSLSSFGDHFNENVAEQIEDGCYHYTKQYCENDSALVTQATAIYINVTTGLIFNLESDNETIKELKTKIKKKQFNPYNLAFLKPHELNEENWSRIISRKVITEKKLLDLPTVEWRPCKCKCTQYLFRQEQTRSSDEPMTTFYTCKNCYKLYRYNN